MLQRQARTFQPCRANPVKNHKVPEKLEKLLQPTQVQQLQVHQARKNPRQLKLRLLLLIKVLISQKLMPNLVLTRRKISKKQSLLSRKRRASSDFVDD